METQSCSIKIIAFEKEKCAHDKGVTHSIPVNNIIHFVESGKGMYKGWHLEAGDAFVCRRNEYSYWKPDEKNPWTYTWIAMKGEEAEKIIDSLPLRDNVFKWNVAKNIDLLNNLISIPKINQTYSDELNTLGNFCKLMSNIISSNQKMTTADHINNAILYMQNHFSTGVTVSETAEALHLSRAYFRNIFYAATGTSPMTFLMKLRMERAVYLLAKKHSISEIANAVGYNDVLQFSRIFHKYYGMSPSAYRKGLLDGTIDSQQFEK